MIHLEHMQNQCSKYVDFMGSKLQQFVLHNFVATWQDCHYRLCMANQSPDYLVSYVDFAKNYSFMQLNEIQTHHWHNFQITILVHLTWRINHNFSVGNDEKTRMITKYHFYISNDCIHDNRFVQHCFRWHWTWLQAWNIKLPTEHTIWNDGCAFQLKCVKVWFHVSRYHELTKSVGLPQGCVMGWNFFGTGHGKG